MRIALIISIQVGDSRDDLSKIGDFEPIQAI